MALQKRPQTSPKLIVALHNIKNEQKILIRILSIDLGSYQNVILVFFAHFHMLYKATINFGEV